MNKKKEEKVRKLDEKEIAKGRSPDYWQMSARTMG